MEGVAAALGGDVDHAARGAAELGEIAVRLHLEFVQPIHVGSDVIRSGKVAVVVNAVEREGIAAVSLSVDGWEDQHADRRGSLPTSGILRHADRGRARREREQLGEIAYVEWQIGDLFLAHERAELGRGAFEHWRARGHLDLFADRANLQREVETHGLIHVEPDAFARDGLESGGLRRDLVIAGIQIADRVITLLVGGRGSIDLFVHVGDLDGRAGEYGARYIRDSARDLGGSLRQGGDGEDYQQK